MSALSLRCDLRCVTSQKSEDLISTITDAWNHATTWHLVIRDILETTYQAVTIAPKQQILSKYRKPKCSGTTPTNQVYSVTKRYMVKWNTAVFLLYSYMFRAKSAIIRRLIQFLKRNIKNAMYNTWSFYVFVGYREFYQFLQKTIQQYLVTVANL